MSYSLGIDVGTTYTGVAIARDGRPEIFPLGHDRPTAPTIVVVRDTGEILVGDAAERRAATEPNRVAREFKRRIGDPAPLIVGGTPYGVDALFGHVLHWVYGRVVEQEGGPPAAITLTHPASWAGFKQDILRQAARLGDLPPVELLTEPQAAALQYAAEGRLAPGAIVAVYDFGGGTFDAALVRSIDSGFDLIGEPEGMERLGGLDFDQAVFAHVDLALDGMIQGLDSSDPAVRAGLLQLRIDCRLAKETLSTDTDTVIPVLVPGISTEVRLTRAEFEAMIRPRVVETVDALRRTLRSADLEPDEIGSILLVGGSSRIPLVAQILKEEIGRPVVVDSHPKFTISLGAALEPWRTGSLAGGIPPIAVPEAGVAATKAALAGNVDGATAVPAPPPAQPPRPQPEPIPPAPNRPAWLVPTLIAAAAAAVILVIVVIVGLGGGSEDASESVEAPAATATTTLSATNPPATASPVATATTTPSATSPSATASPATTTTVPETTLTTVEQVATTPTSVPATTIPDLPVAGFMRVTSFDGALTIEIPTDWNDIDTSPFVVVTARTAHISASGDLATYLDTWNEPGITIALVDPSEGGSVEALMSAVGEGFGYNVECDGGLARRYDDGRVVGLIADWENCGRTSTAIRTIVGVIDDDPTWLLLAGIQAPDPDDLAVLDHVLATLQGG